MKICVVSDSHDNRPLLEAAVRQARDLGAEAVLHCGDVVAPSTLSVLRPFGLPIHVIPEQEVLYPELRGYPFPYRRPQLIVGYPLLRKHAAAHLNEIGQVDWPLAGYSWSPWVFQPVEPLTGQEVATNHHDAGRLGWLTHPREDGH